MTDKIWWSDIPNSSRFIDDIAAAFEQGSSVVCVIPMSCEWKATFRETILEKIHSGVNKTFQYSGKEIGDASPGEFLAENFVKRELRDHYRTSIGYEAFLTRIESETSLSHSYVYLKDLSDRQVRSWIDFIKAYNKKHSPGSPRCKFIIESSMNNCEDFSGGRVIRRSDYLHSYDITIFCMLASSVIEINDIFRSYLTELASFCSGNDPEFAAVLIEEGTEFIRSPDEIISKIIESQFRSDGEPFSKPDDLDSLIRKAQHRVFYPLIEQYRLDLIRRYESEIPLHETITNLIGEEIESVYDIELNTIKWLCDNGKMHLPKTDYDKMKFFKQCRNDLSHLKTLSFSILEEIIDIYE